MNFWEGLNSGPVLWIMFFYFLFHFQPAMGALWNNYLIENLGFSQTQIGFSDGASNLGLFLGVLLFAWVGVKLQDRYGLKRLFKIFILLSIIVNLTQYLLVDPFFTDISDAIARLFPGFELQQIRLGYLAVYNFLLAIIVGVIRMSTFSLVGSVIPVKAAGSLFAGFMSISNLAYSFSYSSGAWLYENGLQIGFVRRIQESLFGIPGHSGDLLSINMLILAGSAAYLLSFLASHMLPDQRQTQLTEIEEDQYSGPESWLVIGRPRVWINRLTLPVMLTSAGWLYLGWGMDPVSSVLLVFFAVTFLRKVALDLLRDTIPT